MPQYCLDTSGLSSPYEDMPPDIHASLWNFVFQTISNGQFAVTKEIFDEMALIPNGLGDYIKDNKDAILYDIGHSTWNWREYLENSKVIIGKYKSYIKEYCGGSDVLPIN